MLVEPPIFAVSRYVHLSSGTIAAEGPRLDVSLLLGRELAG